MTKDLFDKYIWLVDTIYRAGKITFEEINERWLRSRLSEGEDIPLRTFHNWRIAIEQVFDININCNRKGGYYYYIENADDMQKGGIRNWLLNTFAYLTSVIEAMRDGLEIELYYQSYWYEEPSTYTLQPYCIKVFKQRWYVIGFCKERNNIRTFSLDRIQRLTTLDTKFVYPKEFDPEAYFTDYFGIMIESKKLETIRIKVYGMHVQYIRALPLHRSQCEIETTVDYSIFEYRMKPTLDFRQELLSRGADVEVLAPLTFREEMIQSVEKMSSLYNKQ